MADETPVETTPATPEPESEAPPAKKAAAAKKTAAKKTTAKKAPAKKAATKKSSTAKTAAEKTAEPAPEAPEAPVAEKPAKKAAAKRATAKKTTTKAAAAESTEPGSDDGPGAAVLFQVPEATPAKKAAKKTAAKKSGAAKSAKDKDAAEAPARKPGEQKPAAEKPAEESDDSDDSDDESGEGSSSGRRRRRRGGRRRRKSGSGSDDSSGDQDKDDADGGDADDDESGEGGTRRRRRRRREGDPDGHTEDDPKKTTTRVRKPRSAEDEITAVSGSTRLEAKKQRRREGREAGRRRAPIVSEAEFLARRESVDRTMVIRQRDELTQIGVIEDKVLVEHYVARESQTSLIGNIYLGRVQNVLPSMEAAFIDIGKGRNAVLYAGEVNWSALGHKDGNPRKIESVLSSGQSILVQVTKDPVGHKGARLTSQISLAGRFLVYVPDGTTSGISRKLPDTERNRLKTLLKEVVPSSAGVIVRTAAEGASEDELTRDVERLKARWDDIEGKRKGSAPQLLYGEPDLTLKVVRDLFTEDFAKLVVQGQDAWDTVQPYVVQVAPDLEERLERYEPADHNGVDLFTTYRVDEQIAKALDRKVFLPSGGSLIIDRTEAMTVVDVNTGKFTGSGGNLEETVTKNNLEAAEEVVRQLRLRDIGGIIVVDFIDMVLESNRDLVMRRLVECLGRDRTRHQVAEVTSLGLIQMTRKRIGTGLLEAFSETCDHCSGRGLLVHDMPVEPRKGSGGDEPKRGTGRRRGGRGKGSDGDSGSNGNGNGAESNGNGTKPTPAEFAAMAKHAAEVEAAEAAEAEAAEAAEAVDTPDDPVADIVEQPAAEEPAAEEPAAEEPAAEEPGWPEEPAAEEPAAEPEAPPAPPSGPQVVTRTRRGVSRTVTPTAAAPVEVAAAPAADAAPPVAPPAPPAPPKVTTRSRGRGRAAAPAEEAVAAEPAPVEHVPVKKKGARKR